MKYSSIKWAFCGGSRRLIALWTITIAGCLVKHLIKRLCIYQAVGRSPLFLLVGYKVTQSKTTQIQTFLPVLNINLCPCPHLCWCLVCFYHLNEILKKVFKIQCQLLCWSFLLFVCVCLFLTIFCDVFCFLRFSYVTLNFFTWLYC